MNATWANWHGTEEEASALTKAVEENCSCAKPQMGFTPGIRICEAHQLLSEQRALDGLLFAKRIVARLRAEEREAASSRKAIAA